MNTKAYYETVNNKKIFCCFTEPVRSEKKILIMSHGFRGSSNGPARSSVVFERILVENGISVHRFDQPNSSNSEGDYIDSSFKEWVRTLVYFVNKYVTMDYQVALFGQSMGASATVIATNQPELQSKIPCILLWVPDPETDFNDIPNQILEEGGQIYNTNFWQEAKNMDFFGCLKSYKGGIHLVYGEFDKYISQELRNQTIKIVKEKNQPFMILKGQEHSPWQYDLTQEVYKEELIKLKEHFK